MRFYLTNQRRLKQITIACSLVLFSHTLQAKSQQQEVLEICTMSQNVLTDKMLVSMDVTYSQAQEGFTETKSQLTKKFDGLKKKKLSKKLHKKATKLQKSWKSLDKKLLIEKILKKDALNLYRDFSAFDTQCQALAKGLKGSKSKKYDILSKLNLQVQSLTALYTLKSWGVMDDKLYSKKVSTMMKRHQSTRKSLSALESKDNLAKVDKEFTALKFMVQSSSGRYMPLLADKKASAINDIITQILEGK